MPGGVLQPRDGHARFPDPHRRRHRRGRHPCVLRGAAPGAHRQARASFAIPGARELGVAPFSFVTPSGAWTLALDGDTHRDRSAGADGVAAVAVERRRRRRRRQRPEDADDVPHRRHGSTCCAATSATSSTGGSCCARSSTGARCTPAARSTSTTAPARRSICTARSGPKTTTPTSPHFLAEAGFLHLRGWFDAGRMAAISRRHGRGAADLHARRRQLVVGPHGRRRRPLRAHAVVPGALARRRARCSRRDRYLRIGRLTDDDYRTARARQPDRGAREADRCRRRHLGRALAQGLLARHALVPLLRPHGRHLGDRRRRPLRPAARRRGFAPRARAARVRPLRVDLPSSTCRQRPATSPCTAPARCTCRSRRSSASAASCTPGSGSPRSQAGERSSGRRSPTSGRYAKGAYKTVSQAPGYTGAR